MQKSKTLNYSENYDPLEHLEQSLKDDGLPAFMPYVKDGIVAVENGRIVMVPRLHLSANAYRDWFLKAFPCDLFLYKSEKMK